MHSLHSRLLLVATLVLAGFLGATGIALDSAFRNSTETALQERLQSYIYALLAASDEDSNGHMLPPKTLPEPRFSKPDSGLYARIMQHDGTIRWQSDSLAGRNLSATRLQQPGMRLFSRKTSREVQLNTLAFGVAWEDYAGDEALYTFTVAEDSAGLQAETASFRATLWRWLGGMALALLLAQGFILRWGLRPLRRVAQDLEAIQQGHSDHLAGPYPKELNELTTSLNKLLEQGKSVQTRYRHSLDDLAHSLKTPLAILQSGDSADKHAAPDPALVREQVARMNEIISHQLQRAAVSGRAVLAKPVPVNHVIEQLIQTLNKVYHDKQVAVSHELEPAVDFTGDAADLTELLGNLIENAYKYCHRSVYIATRHCTHDKGIEILIEDDGTGIAKEQIAAVLTRGARLDESVPGQGIGLSMSNEIIALYGGQLSFETSTLGGAALRIYFPRADTPAG